MLLRTPPHFVSYFFVRLRQTFYSLLSAITQRLYIYVLLCLHFIYI